MPCRERVCAEPLRITPHLTELDLPVATYVRVGGAARCVFREEVCEDLLAVFVGEVDTVQRQIHLPGDLASILEIPRGVTIAVVFPVAHVQALYVVALVTQEQSGDR